MQRKIVLRQFAMHLLETGQCRDMYFLKELLIRNSIVFSSHNYGLDNGLLWQGHLVQRASACQLDDVQNL